MESPPLYRQLATHYLDAIRAGSLKPGDKLPSLRSLMRQHAISLSTALQLCRALDNALLQVGVQLPNFLRGPLTLGDVAHQFGSADDSAMSIFDR